MNRNEPLVRAATAAADYAEARRLFEDYTAKLGVDRSAFATSNRIATTRSPARLFSSWRYAERAASDPRRNHSMKRDVLSWVIIVLLVANLLANVAGCSRPAGWKRMEYKVAVPGPEMGPKEIEELLNQLGQEGWILVHAMPGLGLLLRR